MSALVEPFRLTIPDAELETLRHRLRLTRWPDRETVADTSQGPPSAKIRALVDYWQDAYDWRRCEALLNGLGQHRTTIDGLGIHFLHIRSPEPDALPLLLTHGWPGSVLEFRGLMYQLPPHILACTFRVNLAARARDWFSRRWPWHSIFYSPLPPVRSA